MIYGNFQVPPNRPGQTRFAGYSAWVLDLFVPAPRAGPESVKEDCVALRLGCIVARVREDENEVHWIFNSLRQLEGQSMARGIAEVVDLGVGQQIDTGWTLALAALFKRIQQMEITAHPLPDDGFVKTRILQ